MIDAARKMLAPLLLINKRIVVGVGLLAAVMVSEIIGQMSYLS